MNNDGGLYIVFTVVMVFAAVLGPCIANDVTNISWQKHLIKEKHAEWRIDSETGEKSFELVDIPITLRKENYE